MPEAVLLEEAELTAVRKAEFADTLRARLSEKVLAEIRLLADMLEGAIARVVFEGRGADAVRENLEEFSRAVEASIDGWVAESGNMAKLAREQRVGVLDVRGLALVSITKVAKSRRASGLAGTEEGGSMTTFTKASDVIAEATREAEKLVKAHPDKFPSVAAARAQVWRDRPDLADALQSFPLGEEVRSGGRSQEAATGVSKLAPVEKGQAAVDKATEKAREMVQQNPNRYRSIEQARAQVWKLYPELAEQYQSEVY